MSKTLGSFIRVLLEAAGSKVELRSPLDQTELHLKSHPKHQLELTSNLGEVTGITSDSREVQPGFIFVAIQGGSLDGRQFIRTAVQSGAILIVGESEGKSLDESLGLRVGSDELGHGQNSGEGSLASSLSVPASSSLPSSVGPLGVPYLRVTDARKALSSLAAQFYGNPSQSLLVIGVTGTSGKTTTAYLVESILQAAGHHVGMIGTISFRFGQKVYPSTHTTPGPVELQRLLLQMKEEGCTAVVMEVSSHALKQKRVSSIAFDGMIFTNLSPEHLDFHPDMEDYYQAKALLFGEVAEFSLSQGKAPVGAINLDDEYGRRLLASVSKRAPHSIASANSSTTPNALVGSNFAASNFAAPNSVSAQGFQVGATFKITPDGISGSFNGVKIQSPMTGHFNCSNIAGAVRLAQSLGITSAVIENGISQLTGVPGRLERVLNDRGVHVWVDYAHKPDALEKVLKTLGELRRGHRLITVFGCGGDRDRKKRPLMGKIAVVASDLVFITSDNPRTEAPGAIIDEILAGTEGFHNYSVEVDRKQAIFKAIQAAKVGDLVLIAGKGHEDYQILGTKKIHFDDREVAADAFRQSLNRN